MKLTKNFRGKRTVRPPGKWGNVTLIHAMHYKPQIFTDEGLQYVFDKCVILAKIFRGKT